LHIHVACLRPEVRDALKNHLGEIGDKWAPLSVPLVGHQYLAMRVNGEELQENPFKLFCSRAGFLFELIADSSEQKRIALSTQVSSLLL